ncbi:ATP-grasp domain-containing protein [Salinicoccus halitifaciens]|uniref:D-alanine-D-alanine ligase-like ATP-grasp enzyme/acylphosphatase n=1 Tax=Salinicoccus halitifaciens TaxID=1073415 RepID=A0ABV2EC01_9STAP|nr:ATP-grasp domain-containing protein [Salinicoccus halitifaciens]MCD2137392.1 ATP-grasp domain-containing protein [Salinicoccus halitifaciens]
MVNTIEESLEHLQEAVPPEGYGNKLSMYLIALEAWRRGIKVNFYTIENPDNKILVRYSLELGEKVHHFESSLGDKLSREAFDVCEYKDLTKKYLKDAGVKVPEGKVFSTSEDESVVLEFVKTLSFPIVVKPLDENAGKGVFSNISSEKDLLDILSYLRDDLGYAYIMIEEFIPGTEYRILTVDGKVEGAVNRIPANIIGNGEDTIQKLIRLKNRSKADNPALSKKRIRVDKEVQRIIESQGYTLESVLEEGERLFLRTKSNISAGGDPVEITENLSKEIISTAEKATQAVPGLNIAGLDMIIDPDTGEPTVIEVNTKPMIGLHVFPVEGTAKDVVKPIVDFYFPETKETERSNLYFDFDAKIAPLDNLTVYEVQVHPLKNAGPKFTRKYEVKLSEAKSGLSAAIRLKALKLGIHGYVNRISSDCYEIVAAGENETVLDKFIGYFSAEDSDFNVSEIEEQIWEKSVNTGFVIKKVTVEELEDRLKKEQKRYEILHEKLDQAEKQLLNEEEKTAGLLEKIEALQAEIDEFKESFDALNKKYISAVLNLGEKERALISFENTMGEKIKALETEIVQLKKKYKDTVNSKSWKLTRPLRRYNPVGKSRKK